MAVHVVVTSQSRSEPVNRGINLEFVYSANPTENRLRGALALDFV